MTFIQTKILLMRLANLYRKEKATFSRQEIVQKINQIKYLSSQKNVPKLTLRKEIMHLENKLQSVFEIEQRLREQKRHESFRMAAMKRQMNKLKNQVTLCEDKNLTQKVDKLSYLLGDYLAKTEAGTKRIKPLTKVKTTPISLSLTKPFEEKKLTPEEMAKVKLMQDRLQALKQELEKSRQMGKDGMLPQLQQKAALIEEKLNLYYQKYKELTPLSAEPHPEVFAAENVEFPTEEIPPALEPSPPMEIRHDILFDFPVPKVEAEAVEEAKTEGVQGVQMAGIESEMDFTKELPLPPPPRMRKR